MSIPSELERRIRKFIRSLRQGDFEMIRPIHRDSERKIADTGMIGKLTDKEQQMLNMLIDIERVGTIEGECKFCGARLGESKEQCQMCEAPIE